jgi:hypothetical protein
MWGLRLATLAGFVLLFLASQVSAQPVPCTGEILGRAPNQLRAVLQAFCIDASAEAPSNLDEMLPAPAPQNSLCTLCGSTSGSKLGPRQT